MMEKEAPRRETMEQCVEGDRRGQARRRCRRGTQGGVTVDVMIYMYTFIINMSFISRSNLMYQELPLQAINV